jgi:hypothetical protein
MGISGTMMAAAALFSVASAVGSSAPSVPVSGFAITDPAKLNPKPLVIAGKTFTPRLEPSEVKLLCGACKALEAVAMIFDKSTDGTEGRLRSGETKIATIAANCQRQEPNCRIDALSLAGAVGWVSRTKVGSTAISTAVLFKGGDRLIIRSIAGDVETAFANGVAVRAAYGTRVIGGK